MYSTERKGKNNQDNDFSFEIVKSFRKLGQTKQSGYTKELNYVSFKGAEPKWDLREWNEDHTRMSKGITLTNSEIMDLFAASEEVMAKINENEGKEETASESC